MILRLDAVDEWAKKAKYSRVAGEPGDRGQGDLRFTPCSHIDAACQNDHFSCFPSSSIAFSIMDGLWERWHQVDRDLGRNGPFGARRLDRGTRVPWCYSVFIRTYRYHRSPEAHDAKSVTVLLERSDYVVR